VKRAYIKAVEYHLPEKQLTNQELAHVFPEWTAEKIEEKLGIKSRRLASSEECSSDLAVKAAEKLLNSGVCSSEEIDFVVFCTQSPDYLLPTTACLIQDRLGLPRRCGAFDINLGCSGWVYGLGIAKGLLETGQARNVLLLTGETYSKFLSPDDRSTRTLFGDAGAATLIAGADSSNKGIGPFVYGTDGSGGNCLKLDNGGMRAPGSPCEGRSGLFMNGGEVFSFSLREVDKAVRTLILEAGLRLDDVDLFIFHQANAYMLETLRRKCGISADRFYVCMAETGNTVSNTIPIALKHALGDGACKSGSLVMFVGFGVGLSWAACLARL
jgi:3-oxoacyl-[acyl-carrier-protein] synthase-3